MCCAVSGHRPGHGTVIGVFIPRYRHIPRAGVSGWRAEGEWTLHFGEAASLALCGGGRAFQNLNGTYRSYSIAELFSGARDSVDVLFILAVIITINLGRWAPVGEILELGA